MSASGDAAFSFAEGLTRNLGVQAGIYPLLLIKTRQQAELGPAKNGYQILREIHAEQGIGGLYKGLKWHLLKPLAKSVYWPLMTERPSFFKRYALHPLVEEAARGVLIALIDATATTYFERKKVLSQIKKEEIKPLFHGWSAYFGKLSVNWVSFLVVQKHLRDSHEGPLSAAQLAQVGVQTALAVAILSAPFEANHIFKQVHNTHLLSKEAIWRMGRGLPLGCLVLLIQNVASVALLDHLEKKEENHERTCHSANI